VRDELERGMIAGVLPGGSLRIVVIALVAVALGACAPAYAADATTSVASLSSTGVKGDSDSLSPSVSADGRWVAFVSSAHNLVSPPSTGTGNIFLRDRKRGETIQVNLTPSGGQPDSYADVPSVSDDGRYVAFYSDATDLVASPGGFQAYLFDRSTGLIRRMSTNVAPDQTYTLVNDIALSGDGRKLLFTANYETAPFTTHSDVFVADVASGAVKRLAEPSPGTQPNGSVFHPTVSADGHWAAYGSLATDIVTPDTNGAIDVFAENLDTGAKAMMSVRSDGQQANGGSQGPSISADGCVVAFSSSATNIVVGAETSGTKTFVRDRCQNTIEAGSVSNAGTVTISGSFPRISGDGCSVAYRNSGLFLRDRCAGLTTRLDVSTAGDTANGAVSPGPFDLGGAKGRYAVFASAATNLAGADTDTNLDVFLRDRANNTAPKAVVAVTQSGSRVTVDATGSTDPDGFTVTGAVGFGDGSAEASGLTASHDYARGGTYTLTVTVTDADGATDRSYQAVTVPDPPVVTPNGGDGGTPPPAGGAGSAKLRLSSASLSRSAFSVAPASGRPSGKQGATLSATLSEASTLTLSFSRRVAGHRSGGHCTARAHRGAPCKVYKSVGSSTRKLKAGVARIALTGRVGSTVLKPGTYRLAIRAQTPDGRKSSTVTLSFTLVSAGKAKR
jgi:Tol biopolymer transport system component